MVQFCTRLFTIEFPHLLPRAKARTAKPARPSKIKGTGALLFDEAENLLRVVPPLYHLEEVHKKIRIFHEAFLSHGKTAFPKAAFSNISPKELSEIISLYFQEGLPLPNLFDPKVAHVSGLSSFQNLCFKHTCIIPLGETRAYNWISQKMHKPKCERAVGTALKSNPFPLFVPCHRVIKKDGALGGFMGSHAPETWHGQLKKILLELEGFHRQPSLFGNHGLISLESFN